MENYQNWRDILPVIVSLVIGVPMIIVVIMNFILSRKIYDKLDRRLKDVHFDAIKSFIEDLKKHDVGYETFIIDSNLTHQSNTEDFKFYDLQEDSIFKGLDDHRIIIQKNVYNKYEFIYCYKQPFFPKKLSNLLTKLDFSSAHGIGRNLPDGKYIFLHSSSSDGRSSVNQLGNSPDGYSYSSESINTFGDFRNTFKLIYKEIDRWMKNPDVDINL